MKCKNCGLKQASFALPAEGKTRWCGGCAKAVNVSDKKRAGCEGDTAAMGHTLPG